MAIIRRALHIVAWIGTSAIILLSLVLIVSQTPWFRDWIRRVIVREAKQYLNGELTIGQLGGNLFFGVTLSDVAVDVSGNRVIAIKGLEVDYSVFRLVSQGVVLDRITLRQPSIQMTRDSQGWNLGRLVKAPRREADREGPRRPISLKSIVITDGTIDIDDRIGSTVYRAPRHIDRLNVDAGFEYEPVRYSIDLRKLGLRGADPEFLLEQLSGKIAVREDNLYLEDLAIKTTESNLSIEGVVQSYLRTPVIKLTGAGRASLPEIGRILKAVAGYDLHPTLTVKTDGPLDRFAMDLDVTSESGVFRGLVTADFRTPDLRFAGTRVRADRFNLGPIFKNPKQKTDITGEATFDIAIFSEPTDASALDRLSGTFAFRGPRVVAFGYQGANVDAAGTVKGPKILLARARANAYGGVATAKGSIVLPQGRHLISYDLEGTARNVDLRKLPASLRAPKLETNLAVSAYHIRGTGTAISGSATLETSQVEGATVAAGTVAEFDATARPLRYGARGSLSDLDVQRLGKALEIEALDKPLYAGRINGSFDLAAAGTTLDDLTLKATGTLTDSSITGFRTPQMAFDTEIADADFTVTAKGPFDQLNPAVFTARKGLDGNVNGAVDGTFRIRDLRAPFTVSAFEADGRVTLQPSLVGSVQIAAADVEGRYQAEVADLTRLQVKGPDVSVEASGRLALDRASQSNLKYHIDSRDISEVGRLAGQDALDGSVVLDGTITGNAAALSTNGTLAANGLVWNDIKALELASKYTVDAPEMDFVNAKVEAASDASFVEIAGNQIKQITAKMTYEKKNLAFETKLQEQTRELDATGSVIFHPDHQEIHMPQLALRTEGIEWRMMPGGDPVVQYHHDRVILKDIKLASGDQTIGVDGTLSRVTDQPSGTLEVHARNVDLAQAERLLLQNRGLHGRLLADATISGTASQPVVDGHVEVRDGAFQNYKYQSLVADVDYSGTKITLDATLQQAPDVAITAKGDVPMSIFERSTGEHVAPTADDVVDLRIQTAALNLGVVQGFTTAVANVGGTLQADVRVTGSGRDPHLGGFIEIRDGAFSVPRAGTSYAGLDTRIDLEPDVIRIRRFEILDENGEQLVVAGQLAVHEREVGAVDITLESENFEVIDNELGDVGIGSRLKVTGQLLRPKLEGEVRIATGRLELDRILQLFYDPYRTTALPEVVSAEQTAQTAGSAADATRLALERAEQGAGAPAPKTEEKPAAEAASPNAFEGVALDVRLRIPDNLVVRGRKLRPGGPTRAAIGDLNVTVGGDLTVKKDPGGPVTLVGVVNTVRGTYQFQGRQFDLARDGTLRFAGEPSNPIVDVTAVRQIPDTGVEARIRITGSLTQPELALSSTPPLDESDILSLIVFNRPINELGTGERASLAATAGGIATGFIATPLGQSIGRALDLDLFEITTSAEGDTLGAGVTVGEQIGDRTFLKLRQQFGERSYTEFLVEYRISDFLRLAASAAPETSGAGNRIGQRRIEAAGIDLIFFFSY
jgi:translocation and assembly module TamB